MFPYRIDFSRYNGNHNDIFFSEKYPFDSKNRCVVPFAQVNAIDAKHLVVTKTLPIPSDLLRFGTWNEVETYLILNNAFHVKVHLPRVFLHGDVIVDRSRRLESKEEIDETVWTFTFFSLFKIMIDLHYVFHIAHVGENFLVWKTLKSTELGMNLCDAVLIESNSAIEEFLEDIVQTVVVGNLVAISGETAIASLSNVSTGDSMKLCVTTKFPSVDLFPSLKSIKSDDVIRLFVQNNITTDLKRFDDGSMEAYDSHGNLYRIRLSDEEEKPDQPGR